MRRIAVGLYRRTQDRRAVLFVTALTILSYGVSLLRERANAAAFGTSGEMDAYLVASSVISLIAITPSRALYEGLVLAIASRGESEPDVAAATARAAIGIGVTVLAAASVVALATTSALVRSVAPELSALRLLEAQGIARALIPTIVVLGLWEITRGVLHGYHEFFRSSAVPIFAPFVTFVAVTLLSGSMGIYSLVLGSILGALLQALVGLVLIVRLGVPLTVSRTLLDLGKLRSLAGPVTASATLTAVAMLWVASDRFLASSLPEGRIAALSYASLIYAVVLVVAITGPATLAFPRLARSAHAKEGAAFSDLLKRSVLETALAALALTVFFVLFATPVVHVLLGQGQFDAESERLTAECLLAYLVFLPVAAPASVVARSVYALDMLRLLVAQAVIVLLAKIIVGLLLRDPFQHVGVAAASGLATMLGGAIVLTAAMRGSRRLEPPPGSANTSIRDLAL